MSSDHKNQSASEKEKMPSAETGNASNPSPENETNSDDDRQLLGKKAEKYIRESGNIEDMPDAQDEYDADKNMARKEGPNPRSSDR
jgi:hypothetical protein